MSKRNWLCVGIAVAGIMFNVAMCRADQPACTGDRHYDGVGCCPATVDPPPCPEVKCDCGGDTNNNYTVTVNRCPDYKYISRIDRCHYNRKSGKVVCPNKDFPRRLLVPQYEN